MNMEFRVPQRGTAYQPRASLWVFGIAYFRVLKERCIRLSRRDYAAFLQNALVLSSTFPGFHPGLVCVAPLGRKPRNRYQQCRNTPGFHPGLVCVAPLGRKPR
jgi:hypothetical protein